GDWLIADNTVMSGIMMMGYLTTLEHLVELGMKLQLGPDESYSARTETVMGVTSMLFSQAKINAKFVGVVVNGEAYVCLAVASNDPSQLLPRKPDPEALARFKKVLGRDKEPKWYRYN
ncbi:hypothetical protein DXG01_011670, partial [Tephrocybe rancida]